MIEAVNSVVANASSLRAGAEGVAASRAPVDIAPVIRVGEAPSISVPKAPYVSPYIAIDRNYNRAVLQIRDSDTGDVLQQFPSESRLAQITRAAQLASARQVAQDAIQPEADLNAPQVGVSSTRRGTTDFVSVQEVTSSQPANVPSQATAAFAAASQAAQSSQSTGVSVLA